MANKKSAARGSACEKANPVLNPVRYEYVKQHAPDLADVFLTLLPFSYLFGSISAGPQGTGEDEPQYIRLTIDDPRYPGGEDDGISIACSITETRITLHWCCMNGAMGKNWHEEHEITLRGLWSYLQQIPKPFECFIKEVIDG
jgi:hypothetical protein